MLPDAHVCHRTPDRLRIKIPSRKGDEAYFSSLTAHFSGLPGIKSLQANPLTGSVLFISGIEPRRIADHGETNQLFKLRDVSPASGPLTHKVAGDFHKLNSQVKRYTGGEIDLPGLAFLGLVGAGFYQVLLGEFMAPAWYTAFWYATSILTKTESTTGPSDTT